MALLSGTPEAAVADALIDSLAAHGITYITGGGQSRIDAHSTAPEAVVRLIADLVRAPSARLRDALVALLVLHPDYAAYVRVLLARLGAGDPRYRPLLARLLAAAALQHIWSFVLGIYLGDQPHIDVDDLCVSLNLPSPMAEHGEALLRAAALLLDPSGTVNWVSSWEDAAEQLLTDLRLHAAATP